eukprot:4098634-Alexandrium_andersonii.AAC.1
MFSTPLLSISSHGTCATLVRVCFSSPSLTSPASFSTRAATEGGPGGAGASTLLGRKYSPHWDG